MELEQKPKEYETGEPTMGEGNRSGVALPPQVDWVGQFCWPKVDQFWWPLTKEVVGRSEITIFDLPWARVDVRPDRFTLRGKDAAFFPMIRDLSVGIFQLLEYSPVTGVGINSILTYMTKDINEWHRIGDALVPKDKWRRHLKGHIGMARVSISAERDDDLLGTVNITVVPVVLSRETGIIVDINNHIELESAGELPSILNQHWERLQKLARTMADEILEEAAQ